MNETALRELGFSEGIIEHLRDYQPSASLGYRVQPPLHWRASSIADKRIVALWECGTDLTYFDQSSATFRKCSLENTNADWFRYRSVQAVLAQLFIELYEDELPNEQLLSVAQQVGFVHAEHLLREAEHQNSATYKAWATAFPLACET
jgi:hypothetical protein